MTFGSLLDRGARKVDARLQTEVETVQAVFDTQLWEILASHGLLDKLNAGELRCYVTGVPLTRENVGGFVMTPDGIKIIADSYAALSGVRSMTPVHGPAAR